MENCNTVSVGQRTANLNNLFRPFNYPHQIVSDPNTGLEEKRAILAAWASDEHAVESLPTLRHLPGTPLPVTLSAIMDARIRLDRMFDSDDDDPWPPPATIRHFRKSPAAQGGGVRGTRALLRSNRRMSSKSIIE